jgi:hypothetical protein
MNNRTFRSLNDLDLIVTHRKSAVIFEMAQNQSNEKYKFSFEFTPDDFDELLKYIETISNNSWVNLNPKEADSLGADYYEYYDRELDNNGYLTIKKNVLLIERPALESGKLYQFNKKKMESFIFDFKAVSET